MLVSNNLQYYIYYLINYSPYGTGFLKIRTKYNFNGTVGAISKFQYDSMLNEVLRGDPTNIAQTGAYAFLLADLILYAGIIAVICKLSVCYSKYGTEELVAKLMQLSSLFIYGSLVTNLVGLYGRFEFLNRYTLVLFDGSYSFSIFSQIGKIVILLLMVCLYAIFSYTINSSIRLLELPLLLQINAALCTTILSSTNLALLLLALEGFSLVLYVMTALGRSYGGITASVKYFAFGTLGSIFLFWSAVHFYAVVPCLSYEVVNAVFNKSYFENESLVKLLDFVSCGFTLGFMLKLGAAPTHQWVADVYSGVHMYITAFFSIFVKFILFVAFLQLSLQYNGSAVLNQFIVLSLIVGCFMSINQTDIKRLIAYSSIVHVAFLFMGDAPSSLLYLLTYCITSLLLFSVLLSAELGGKELMYLNDLRHLRASDSFSIFCAVSAFASSAGLPPFAGFYGKFSVWCSLIEDIYLFGSKFSYFALLLSLLVTLLTVYYYIRVIAYLFVGQDSEARAVSLTSDLKEDFYTFLFSCQGILLILVMFWTFVQSDVLGMVGVALIST